MRSQDPIHFAPQRKLGGGWICWKDSPSPPPAPDYVGAAQAQGTANKESAVATAMLSNPNVQNPYGSQTVTYSQGPDGNLIPNVTQALSPVGNQLLDASNATKLALGGLAQTGAGIAQGTLNTPFSFGASPQMRIGDAGPITRNLDTSGVPAMPVGGGTTAQQAILARLAPQLDREQAALDNKLANQGIMRGSEAYKTDQTLQAQRKNDLESQAALQGIGIDMGANQQAFNQAATQGGFQNAAQQQEYNQELQSGQFGNTATQQALAQALQLRSQPLNEINALTSSSQINNPQFQGYSGQTIAPAPLFNATQAGAQYGQNAYNQQVASNNAQLGGLFSLGGAALQGAGAAGRFGPLLSFI